MNQKMFTNKSANQRSDWTQPITPYYYIDGGVDDSG